MTEDCYFGLTVMTLIVTGLSGLLYQKTKHLGFVVGIGLFYFWSLYGAWFIVLDKSGGVSGMKYSDMENGLFHLYLDQNYLLSLYLYGFFIIVLELTLIILVETKSRETRNRAVEPVEINHRVLLAVVLVSGVVSYFLVRNVLRGAEVSGVSAYAYKNAGFVQTPVFTYYQVINRATVIVTMLGLATAVSGRKPRLIRGLLGDEWMAIGYCTALGALLLLNFLMGAKNALFSCSVTAILFYLANAERPRIGLLVTACSLGGLVMGMINLLRGHPIGTLYNTIANLSFKEISDAFEALVRSNEMFAAHYSMYGALSFHIPITFGAGIAHLLLGFIPRFLWPDKPTFYSYYADFIGVNPDQGFTLHHATGWFLDFGVWGIIMGAMVLGAIWAFCYNTHRRDTSRFAPWRRLFNALAPFLMVGYLPQLVRSPTEVLRPFALEGFVIPIFMLTFTIARKRRFLLTEHKQRRV